MSSALPNPPSKEIFDIIIVGGSFAGLSAALNIARARTDVLIIDGGHPRNEPAAHSHGFLTQDHVPPSEILANARRQLAVYPNAFFLPNTMVTGIVNKTTTSPSFDVATADKTFTAQRIILATGYQDELPQIQGIQDAWGHGVFHCPFCHAYEFGEDASLGIFCFSLQAVAHQSSLLSRWTKNLTVFIGGCENKEPLVLSEDLERKLLANGVTIEKGKVAKVVPTKSGSELEYVELVDGQKIYVRGLLTLTNMKLGIMPILESLNIETVDGFVPGQKLIKADPMKKETSVAGIFACGEITGAMNIATAVGNGSQCGAFVLMSLIH